MSSKECPHVAQRSGPECMKSLAVRGHGSPARDGEVDVGVARRVINAGGSGEERQKHKEAAHP